MPSTALHVLKFTGQMLVFTLLLPAADVAWGSVHYVDLNSTNPSPPFSDRTTAATNIQDAVDAAASGDEIVVTDGVYESGSRTFGTSGATRVVVDKPLTLRSLKGPEVTLVRGSRGDPMFGGIRCVYLVNGAILSGFTLTNGVVGGQYVQGEACIGGGVLCQSTNAVVTNCVVSGNWAFGGGGGAYRGTLDHCSFINNFAKDGGGAYGSILNNCRLVMNSAGFTDLTVSWRWSSSGGGACNSTLNNCTLTENSAHDGGGAAGSTLNNCLLSRNSVTGFLNWASWLIPPSYIYYGGTGGGASGGTLNNCTLTGNSAQTNAGGAYGGTLNNCIVYYNSAPKNPNYSASLNYCCTAPMPVAGLGNIASEPRFLSLSDGDFRLQQDSPCLNAGTNAYAPGTSDLDGHARIVYGTVDIGAYEFESSGRPVIITGPLNQAILEGGDAAFAVQAVGSPPLFYQWHFNGTVITGATNFSLRLTGVTTNQAGLYSVVVSNSLGTATCAGAKLTVSRPVTTHFVSPNSPNPTPPYGDWLTAAHTIQEAVDVALPGSEVIVTNGLYATGGRAASPTNGLFNRIVVNKPVTLRSVNGPEVTIVRGSDGMRCVYLSSEAVLNGFTVTGGSTLTNTNPGEVHPDYSGGGIWCESTSAVLTNCVVRGNSAFWGAGVYRGTLKGCTLSWNLAQAYWVSSHYGPLPVAGGYGGGAHSSTLDSCRITGNSGVIGGGAYGSALHNCTVSGNSVMNSYPSFFQPHGGGTGACTVNNSILYYNTAALGANYDSSCALNFCCTTPLPANNSGNISNEPLFVNQAGGDFRLQTNSPCINAGNNAYALTTTDLDGNPRIVGIRVDIGAYEFQSVGNFPFQPWLQFYGLATNGSADYTDADGDGLNNWQEWRCQTDPLNAQSALRLLSALPNGNRVAVTWQSVAGVNYSIERSTNMTVTTGFIRIATNIAGRGSTTVYADTNTCESPAFYRVLLDN